MFKSFVSKITKVSDRLYIADISIQHDVGYVFLLVEMALRTECASIVAINAVGPNRPSMDNHVAVHPNGSLGGFIYHTADLLDRQVCHEAHNGTDVVAQVIIRVDPTCFVSNQGFNLDITRVLVKGCDEERTPLDDDDVEINNENLPTPGLAPPFNGTRPRYPDKPEVFDLQEFGFIYMVLKVYENGELKKEKRGAQVWFFGGEILDDPNNPWQLVKLNVKGPDDNLRTGIVTMQVRKRRYPAGAPFGIKRFRMTAAGMADWEEGETYEATIRWYGAQGQIGNAKRLSMISTITSPDAPTPLEPEKFRTRESIRSPKAGDEIITKRDPDAVLSDEWKVQTQE